MPQATVRRRPRGRIDTVLARTILTVLGTALWVAGAAVASAGDPERPSTHAVHARVLNDAPEGTFTLAVIPDTQRYHGPGSGRGDERGEPRNPAFDSRTRWLAANLDAQRIVFVTHMGDIVDKDNREQWRIARENMDRLHGRVPYGIAVGNHDYRNRRTGDASTFQQYFSAERYDRHPWYGGTYEGRPGYPPAFSGNNTNSYQLFSAEGLDFVIVHVECNAPDDVLAWADGVIERHRNRMAVISTHMYLGGVTRRGADEPQGRMRWKKVHGDRGNTPQEMWEKSFRRHRNLFLVLCGDQSASIAHRQQSAGEHGNRVHEILQDYPRDADDSDWLRLFRFHPEEKVIRVFTYSPAQDRLCDGVRHLPDPGDHQFVLDISDAIDNHLAQRGDASTGGNRAAHRGGDDRPRARGAGVEDKDTRAPATRLSSGEALLRARRAYAGGDATLAAAVEALKGRADRALRQKPVSVVDKTAIPPSGDKHDYMSMGPYWWPDPDQPDGRPYIRRDGHVNPESRELDVVPLRRMAEAVDTLALAWFYTREDGYAEHAAKLLRAWFLDDATRMNPHLEFGQGIPGRTDGRGIGIIDTVILIRLTDAVELLADATAWTPRDDRQLRDWFRAYLTWLLESAHGIDEARQPNNHGTYYDVQVARFALFVGDEDTARRVLQEHGPRRIATQVEPDGRQPLELRRTLAFTYSISNLRGFFEAATLGEHLGIDLWHFESEDGRSIRKALDWLIPFALEEQAFPYEELGRLRPERLRPLLRQASDVYGDPRYGEALVRLQDDDGVDIPSLRHPGRRDRHP